MKTKKNIMIKVNVNYPVGDFLVRLKNASIARHKFLTVDKSKLVMAVSQTLKKARFLDDVKENGDKFEVSLSYRKKEPVLMDVKLISKPGLRIYKSYEELEKRKSPTFAIVSTSLGVMTSGEAIKKKVGGEVIAEVL